MTTIALDVMGADAGLEALVAGAAQVSREEDDIEVLLVGQEPRISELLAEIRYDGSKLALVHADDVGEERAQPARGLEPGPGASIRQAVKLVADGDADALVSAGATGALIRAASMGFQRLEGVPRAALAAVHPTEQRHGPKSDPFALILDVGATVECTAEDLLGFAIMGSAYSRIISGIERPRVGLLSNGADPRNGTPAIIEAHALLQAHADVEFSGNVEGLDIPRGTVDVVVTDGFLGNVVLKMLEGVSEVIADLARDAYARKFLWKMGLTLLSQGLRQIQTMTDWQQYGGAPLLGFDQVVIQAHGASNAGAIRNAIKVAAKSAEQNLVAQIRAGVQS